LRGLERHLGELLDVEEVHRAQVVVALWLARAGKRDSCARRATVSAVLDWDDLLAEPDPHAAAVAFARAVVAHAPPPVV
jgi:hypothetical protein